MKQHLFREPEQFSPSDPIDGLDFESALAEGHGGLPTDRFNGEWRKVSTVAPCSVADVGAFVKAHYLEKRPAIVMLCLMMRVCGLPTGCVIYSAPPKGGG